MTIDRKKLLICTVVCLSGGLHVFAQETPAFDISGGYSLVRRVAVLDTASFHGWLASLTVHCTPRLAIVGDVGGNYLTLHRYPFTLTNSTHTLMSGGRLTFRRSSISPFAQLLLGAARDAVSGNEAGVGELRGLSLARTRFQLQPGAGVDVRLRGRVGFRAGADYRLRGVRGLRLHAGVAFGAGSR